MSDIVEWLGNPDDYPNILVTSVYRRIYRKSEITNVDTNLRKHMIHRIKSCPLDLRLSTLTNATEIIIMVNPDEATWNSDNIDKAKEFLLDTMNNDITKENILKYGIGEQSNKNVKSYGILACYKYCKNNGIVLDIGISITSLYDMTRMLLYNKTTLVLHLMSLSSGDIINTIMSHGISSYNVRRERLTLMSKFVNDNLYDNMEREYYISWASLKLDINLYDYSMPHIAITLFPQYNKYESHLPKISLLDTFDPRIPPDCYKLGTLKHLTLLEGLEGTSTADRMFYYDFLVNQRTTPTFYKGKHSMANNDYSPIYFNDISDIKDEHLISYGTYDNMTCIPIIELDENFSHYMDLVDMEGQPLSTTTINKLMRILHNSNDDMVIHLKNTINTIKDKISKLDESDRQFIAYYKNHPNKDIIRSFLLECLQCSMYMRGWDGTSPLSYPLDGNTHLKESTIFSNVSIALANIKQFEDKEPIIYGKIMSLDLYAIDNKYNVSLGHLTWRRDRISVLKSKFTAISDNDPDNVEACIRTNSNWILGTIYHYSELIGIAYGFETKDVRFIF